MLLTQGPQSHAGSLLLVLALWGSLHNIIMSKIFRSHCHIGLLSQGSTGSVRVGACSRLLPVSLADVKAHLGTSECECVLEALNSIQPQGVLHGDMKPRHVVYSSRNSLAEPKWVDFSNAREAQSSKKLADEVNQCHGMLKGLRLANHRPK